MVQGTSINQIQICLLPSLSNRYNVTTSPPAQNDLPFPFVYKTNKPVALTKLVSWIH